MEDRDSMQELFQQGLALLEEGMATPELEKGKKERLLFDALACFDGVLLGDPDNISSLANKAISHAELGDLTNSESHLRKALSPVERMTELKPTDSGTWQFRGSIEMKVGFSLRSSEFVDAAILSCERAINFDVNNIAAYVTKFSAQMEWAIPTYNSDLLKRAIGTLKDKVSVDSDYTFYHTMSGCCYYYFGKMVKNQIDVFSIGLWHFDQVELIDERRILERAWCLLYECAFQHHIKRLDEVIKECDWVSQQNAGSSTALDCLGTAYYLKGKMLGQADFFLNSIQCFESALKIRQGDYEFLTNVATSEVEYGRRKHDIVFINRALKHVNESLNSERNWDKTWLARAQAYEALAIFERETGSVGGARLYLIKALSDVARALETNRDSIEALQYRGILRMLLGELSGSARLLENAIADFDATSKQAKAFRKGLAFKAATLVLLYGLTEDEEYLESAVTIGEQVTTEIPDYYDGWKYLAIAEATLGHARNDLSLLRKALDGFDKYAAFVGHPQDCYLYKGFAQYCISFLTSNSSLLCDAIDTFDVFIEHYPAFAQCWEFKADAIFCGHENDFWSIDPSRSTDLSLQSGFSHFLHSNFLNEIYPQNIENFLAKSEKYGFTYPAFVGRSLWHHPYLYYSSIYQPYVSECCATTDALHAYCIELSKEFLDADPAQDINPDMYRGILHYLAGDPITAFRTLNTIYQKRPNDLQIIYYMLQSGSDFLHPILPELLDQANRVLPISIDSQSSTQLYYAGKISVVIKNYDKALEYFDAALADGELQALFQIASLAIETQWTGNLSARKKIEFKIGPYQQKIINQIHTLKHIPIDVFLKRFIGHTKISLLKSYIYSTEFSLGADLIKPSGDFVSSSSAFESLMIEQTAKIRVQETIAETWHNGTTELEKRCNERFPKIMNSLREKPIADDNDIERRIYHYLVGEYHPDWEGITDILNLLYMQKVINIDERLMLNLYFVLKLEVVKQVSLGRKIVRSLAGSIIGSLKDIIGTFIGIPPMFFDAAQTMLQDERLRELMISADYITFKEKYTEVLNIISQAWFDEDSKTIIN